MALIRYGHMTIKPEVHGKLIDHQRTTPDEPLFKKSEIAVMIAIAAYMIYNPLALAVAAPAFLVTFIVSFAMSISR